MAFRTYQLSDRVKVCVNREGELYLAISDEDGFDGIEGETVEVFVPADAVHALKQWLIKNVP